MLKYKGYTVNHIFTSSLKIMPYLFGYSSYGLHGLSFSHSFTVLMLHDYVPLALTCYDLFTVSWMRIDEISFLGGKHHLLPAFIRFCGKTANLSDIAPHHRIDKHKSSHTGWALVLHFFFSLCQTLQIYLIYLEQMHTASCRYSSSVLPDSKVRSWAQNSTKGMLHS